MERKKLRLVQALFFLLIGSFIAVSLPNLHAHGIADVGMTEESLGRYAYLVDEFDSRRRLNFLFPNPQSIFDGLSIGYVQTSTGNLTFQRRDLVVLGSENIVAARVFDSRSKVDTGFGPRWRLNLVETLTVSGNGVLHTDSSGASHRFTHSQKAMYEPALPSPSSQGTTLAVLGNHAVIRSSDGSIRQFEQFGQSDTYLLVRHVSNREGVTTFVYDDNRMNEVHLNGDIKLSIQWSDNRIRAIQDQHGRVVTYAYDAQGRMIYVKDVAGQIWGYAYNDIDQLVSAAYADGSQYLNIRYDSEHRVQQKVDSREFSFHYYDDLTIVEEGDGRQHWFEHNVEGVTTSYRNSNNIWWEALLDESNRVAKLVKPTGEYGFEYEGEALSTVVHPEGKMKVIYDDLGRYQSMSGPLPRDYIPSQVRYLPGEITKIHRMGVQMSIRHDSEGRLVELHRDSDLYRIDYGSDALVSSLTKNEQRLTFTRDIQGRLVATRYPNSGMVQYGYDSLGNRDPN